MNRLECLGKSSTGSQKQLAVDITSAHAKMNKHNDKDGKNTDTDKPRRSPPACALPRPIQVPRQETQKSGFQSGDVLKTDKTLLLAAGMTHAPPAAEPLPTNEEEEQTKEEDVEDEDLKAPVKLLIEFLGAVMDRDFHLASRLCQMILIYEPDNPEASGFLPLIQKKLLEEQDEAKSTEVEEEDDEEEVDEDNDDNEDDDSGSDEESSQSSSCSSSSCPSASSSSSDDDEEEVKPVNRHKPCPPSHVCP